MIGRGLFRPWREVSGDRRGAAAIEFALTVPIIVTLFMGAFEVTNLALVDMKLTSAAQTAADLVTQTEFTANGVITVLSNASFAGFTNAAQRVMTPFPATDKAGNPTLKIAYAGFTFNTGAPVLSWHYEENGATPITAGTVPDNQDLTKLATAAAGSLDSVVVVSAQYNYTSPISYVLRKNYTFKEAAFDRPRYVTSITTCQNQPSATGCP